MSELTNELKYISDWLESLNSDWVGSINRAKNWVQTKSLEISILYHVYT